VGKSVVLPQALGVFRALVTESAPLRSPRAIFALVARRLSSRSRRTRIELRHSPARAADQFRSHRLPDAAPTVQACCAVRIERGENAQ
jgi:hypothetical protein